MSVQHDEQHLNGRSAPCPRCAVLEREVVALRSAMQPGAAALQLVGGPRPGDPAPSALPELTAREWEVGTLLAQGMSNAEVATELYLGVNSVKTHIKGLYRKIGVRNRTEAALWFEHHRPTDPRR